MISPNKIIIGITSCGSFPNYERWIKTEPGVDVIRLGYESNNIRDLDQCDAVVLTGGQDVHPRLYRKPGYLADFQLTEVDEKRDEFEYQVLEHTMRAGLPLLGICRGLQICNVFLGGTLVPDIPSFAKKDHSKFEGKDRYHSISVHDKTLLKQITGSVTGEINSAHHQSADEIAPELIANCMSEDGIIEGLERKDPGGKPYLMLVQWHPERMDNLQSPFSKNIRESFVENVKRETSNVKGER